MPESDKELIERLRRERDAMKRQVEALVDSNSDYHARIATLEGAMSGLFDHFAMDRKADLTECPEPIAAAIKALAGEGE